MVVQINSWTWLDAFTDSLGILREEESYNYNFQDANWNDYASARKSQEFISDLNESTNPAKTHQLDRENTGGSFRVRKEDVSADDWADLDPNDKTGTIDWDDVVEISIGRNEWKTFENFDRNLDGTYEGSEERIEYFELIEDQWGNSWPERVGVIETQGNMQRVYDRHWELVGTQTKGDLVGVKLDLLLDGTDYDLLAEFRSVISKYIDLDAAEIIESETGPAVLVENGQIVASIYGEENLENSDTQLYWNRSFEDVHGDRIIDLGGWNQLDTAGDPSTVMAKPNGVFVREYFYKDQLSDAEWSALEQEASFNFSGFDWDEVGILTKKIWKNDWDNTGFRERTEYKFIKVDPISGRQDWNYFRTEIEEDGVTEIQDGNGTVLGYDYPAGSAPVALVDAIGSEYGTLIELMNAHLMMHGFQSMDVPMFSSGEFKAMGSSVTWTQIGQTSPLSLFGQLYFDKTPNEWGNKEFRLEFDRDDGNPLVELVAWVSTNPDGSANYEDAEIRISEYVYKTDLDSTANPKAETSEWSSTMTTYGPSVAFKTAMGDVWDGVAPDIEVIELQQKYRYRDNELKNFDPLMASSSIHHYADETRARFMEGTVQSNDELDIEWTWEQDYYIEFSGGVAALTKGDGTVIAMELATQGNTPMAFSNNYDLFVDQSSGQMLLDAISTLYGTELEAAIPGFSTADLRYVDNGVVLVGTNDVVLARGDYWKELQPNEYGHASFGLRFSGPDGHPLIGFGAYSTVDENGKFDFANYGTRLMEYIYKSDDLTAWAAAKQKYGPTADLQIADWDTDVQLIEVTTRHHEDNGSPTAITLTPSFNRYDARFVEGEITTSGRLELYFNWETDDRIEFKDGLEIHKQGNNTIDSHLSRDLILSDVTDLDTGYVSGFNNLVDKSGILAGVLATGGALTFQKDTETDPSLYVFHPDRGFRLKVDNVKDEWINTYGFTDVAQAYSLYNDSGTYLGWLWESNARDYTDMAGEEFAGAKSYASNLRIYRDSDRYDLDAWNYLFDTFALPTSATYEPYDVSSIRVRHEKVFDSNGLVNENIFLQYDLPGLSNAHRVGYDITKGKKYAFTNGEWPEPTDTDYDTFMSNVVTNAEDVGTSATALIKENVEKILASVWKNQPLADDFYIETSPDVANADMSVDAGVLMDGMQKLEGLSTNATEEKTFSTDGETFTFKVTDGSDVHSLSISSDDITNFGGQLNGYAQSTEGSKYDLLDMMEFLDVFVADAINASDYDSGLGYTATYTVNGVSARTYTVDDASAADDYMPIFFSPDPSSDAEEVFIIQEDIGNDSILLYTPDNGVAVEVTNLTAFGPATQKLVDELSVTQDEALEIAVEDFVMQFFGGEEGQNDIV